MKESGRHAPYTVDRLAAVLDALDGLGPRSSMAWGQGDSVRADVASRAILNVLHAVCLYDEMAVPKAIQIRDVPDDVHARLRARAAETGMSMSEYLRSELIRLAGQDTIEEVYARILTRHGGVSTEEIVRTIREMRGPLES